MTGGGGTDPTKNGPNTHIIVGRGILIPLCYKYPLYCLPPFFKFCLTPLPFPVACNHHPHCSFCCLVSLVEWVIVTQLMCHFT